MDFTPEQRQELENGRPVHVIEPESQLECVVVRADVYKHFEQLLFDDTRLSEDERLFIIREAGRRADWDDPELDVYEQYRKRQ
jgi:hypothetical protein